MKNFIVSSVVILFATQGAFAYKASEIETSQQQAPSFVLCNQNKTMCSIGGFVLRSSGEPLFVNGGIMCTTDKRICTNGSSVLRSTDPQF